MSRPLWTPPPVPPRGRYRRRAAAPYERTASIRPEPPPPRAAGNREVARPALRYGASLRPRALGLQGVRRGRAAGAPDVPGAHGAPEDDAQLRYPLRDRLVEVRGDI